MNILQQLEEADKANQERIETMGDEGAIVLNRVQFDRVVASLSDLERRLRIATEALENIANRRFCDIHDCGDLEHDDGCRKCLSESALKEIREW